MPRIRLFLLFLGVLNFLALLLSSRAVPRDRVRPLFVLVDGAVGPGVRNTLSARLPPSVTEGRGG